MGKFLKYFLLFLAFAILVFWVWLQSHQPVLRGRQDMAGLKAEVEVIFDPYGIPHIYAGNAEDAYRAFGYVHAQDRLFQMELMRRVGAGRLSEIFGKEFLETDLFFRTIGTNRKAASQTAKFEELPENYQRYTHAYLDGINAFINDGKLPLEFSLAGIEPEPFQVEDIYFISAYMAYSFSFSIRTDPVVEYIDRHFGPEYLIGFDLANLQPDTLARDTIADTLTTVAALLPPRLPDEVPVPVLQGSNAWMLGPSRTLSGKVIFANDTHIKYSSPSVWYEAHIEYPGFGFYGNFLAGIPVALIGHSRSHSYGMTMLENDDSDFFIERFAASDSSLTVFGDSLTAEVKKYRETVNYDDTDTTITVYETANGVIINDFLPITIAEPISMYWTYLDINSKLLEAFFRMSSSADIRTFESAVSLIGSPGLNVNYGDASGNIAVWAAGKLIKRPEGVGGKRFIPGYVDSLQYQGFYDFSENPREVNPESDLAFSANQMHDTTSNLAYPGYYAPDTRYERIESLLSPMQQAYVDTIKSVSLDVVSKTEALVAHEIARVIIASEPELSATANDALELLLGWDGNHRLKDIEPTIYYKVLFHILRRTLTDELGNDIFELLTSGHLIKRSYPKFIQSDEFPWWDNLKTGRKVETRTDIFVEAFQKSVEELEKELGSDPESWNWERVHFIDHPHPFGSKALLKPFFNVGPFAAPGGMETINNSSFHLNGEGKYTANYGPAMRIILDFGDIENGISILPTGNSGNVLSPHYSDQAEMFVNGDFRKMMMNEDEIREEGQSLFLRPVDSGE